MTELPQYKCEAQLISLFKDNSTISFEDFVKLANNTYRAVTYADLRHVYQQFNKEETNHFNVGDSVYAAEEGIYTLHKFVSKAFKDGYDAAVNYQATGLNNLPNIINTIAEEDHISFKDGWNEFHIKWTGEQDE